MISPRIETERLILRRWQDNDLDAWAAICADAEVMKYISDGKTRTRTQCAAMLMEFDAQWEERGYSFFAMELRESNRFIGFTGFYSPGFLPEIMPAIEIGWRLSRYHWGRGLATEAARAALAYAWDHLDIDRLVSIVHLDNERSANLCLKLGMSLDRETTTPRLEIPVRVFAIRRPCQATRRHGVPTRT